ncbi:MAG: cation:proton antiporter [Gemmatimonadetes bacterium]|nr:cation:proton antiporter [Gemmatimonadota bacterium]
MSDPTLLRYMGFIVVTAALFAVVAQRLNVPTIVAYILAGLLLGPVTGMLEVTHTIEVISEVGIALLLFLVGLELSLEKIRDVGRVALIAGIGQVVFTAAGGFVLAYVLDFTVIESLFLATALTFSSTVVVVKLLDQKKELDSLYGRIAVGIFLVQDLVVIVVLTFLAGLGDPDALELGTLATGIGRAFGGMALLLGFALVAARYVLPRVFGWAGNAGQLRFIWALCWCFLLVMGAEVLDLSLEIGAFLAGISLAQLRYNHDLQRRVHPLMNFFIAVFFVSLGIQMELGAATAQWWPAVVLSLFVLIGNPFIFMLLIARMGYSERTSFLTSVTVAQISEFSFIFAAMGLSAGLIDASILSLIAVVGLVTIAISAYMILFNHWLYERVAGLGVLRIFRAKQEEEVEPEETLRDHVIVVGMNSLGRHLVRELLERGETVLAIDTDEAKLAELSCATLVGDVEYPSVLEEANLPEAKLLVSALQIEDVNKMLAYHCRRLDVPASIHAFDRSVVEELRRIGVSHLMLSKNNGIRAIARELQKEGILER